MEDSRAAFELHVKNELGDIAVMDEGRYISPKIQNYWLTWQASHKAALAEAHQWMLARHEAQKHRDNYMAVEARKFEQEFLK